MTTKKKFIYNLLVFIKKLSNFEQICEHEKEILMKIEEKNWSKALLFAYGHLETICGAIDKTVLSCGLGSSSAFFDTEYVANRMINLIERKKFLINLKLIVDKAFSNMKSKYARVLMLKYIDCVDSKLASEVMKTSTRTFFRQINAGLQNFWESLNKIGYGLDEIKKLLKNEQWILEIYNSLMQKTVKEDEMNNFGVLGIAFKQIKQNNFKMA